MKVSVRILLKKNPDYLALIFASFLSGLGTTFTSLAVFHELESHNADSFLYSIAFALTLLPGLVSSHFSDKIIGWIAPIKLMIGLEILGVLVTGISMHGARIGSLPLLLAALPLGSLSYGLLVPFLNTYSRSRFNDSEFLAVAEISNFVLVADFILGSLVGTLIINLVGVESFFVFDIFTYIFSAGLICLIYRRYPLPFQVARSTLERKTDLFWKRLTHRQKRAFLMYPALVAACSPCTAVLPGAAKNFPSPVLFGSLTLATPLLLMMAKTKGQFLGPFFVRRLKLDDTSSVSLLMHACLLAFLLCYSLVFNSSSLALSLVLVVAAHLSSNIVFTLSFVEFKRNFTATEIGPAATRQYQLSLMIMIGSSVGVGWLTRVFGNIAAVAFGLIALVVVTGLGQRKQRNPL